jgi:hypothetical protein
LTRLSFGLSLGPRGSNRGRVLCKNIVLLK